MHSTKKRLALAASVFALLLSGCAPTANDAAPAKVAAPAANAKATGRVDANPALWVVKDADTTVYLFGTVHVLRANVDWFDGPVKAAYDKSGELVLEMVEPELAAAQTLVMSKAVDPDGPPLTKKLGPDLAARYTAAMAKADLPVAQFEGFEPWFAATILSTVPLEKLGYVADSGAEAVLSKAAKASGKPVTGLETMEQQLGYFDTLPEPLQIRFLKSTVDDIANVEAEFAQLIATWTAGKPEELARIMNEALIENPEIGKVLLADRNARWAVQIDDRMDRPGTTFVAVGAGHLAGADSVQAMLTKRGFKVTRIQ